MVHITAWYWWLFQGTIITECSVYKWIEQYPWHREVHSLIPMNVLATRKYFWPIRQILTTEFRETQLTWKWITYIHSCGKPNERVLAKEFISSNLRIATFLTESKFITSWFCILSGVQLEQVLVCGVSNSVPYLHVLSYDWIPLIGFIHRLYLEIWRKNSGHENLSFWTGVAFFRL